MLDVGERISAFEKLGRFISQYEEDRNDSDLAKLNKYFLGEFREAITQAGIFNNWFTIENVHHALQQWSVALKRESLEEWVNGYSIDHFNNAGEKTVALIMAGNLPLVGFHDFLSVLMSGHKVLTKPSSDDDKLLPLLAQVLVAIEPRFAERITFADGFLRNFDAVIATGSNNSARYFEYYFGKYPHIIRKNRSSVAVLSGNENEEELEELGEDVFRYFGLGCRNVSKVYLPEGFDLNRLFKAFLKYKDVVENKKYGNNYDYNRAIYMMERQPFLENGFVIMKAEKALHAPVSVLHYENYRHLNEVEKELQQSDEQLQCVVSNGTVAGAIPLGQAQQPRLWDYADKVDTIRFLRSV